MSSQELTFTDRGFQVDVPGDLRHAGGVANVDIQRVVGEALTRIQAKLGAKPTSIKFFTGPQVVPELGVTGFTNPASGAVTITIDPESYVGVRKILLENFGPALAHEMHHSKRIVSGPGYGERLGQTIVTEGMAVAFEQDVYHDNPPFGRALTAAEELSAWRALRPHLNDADDIPTHGNWFFGTGGEPRWAGYTIGYHIAKSYLLRHPKASAASLALMPSDQLLSQSGYSGAHA